MNTQPTFSTGFVLVLIITALIFLGFGIAKLIAWGCE